MEGVWYALKNPYKGNLCKTPRMSEEHPKLLYIILVRSFIFGTTSTRTGNCLEDKVKSDSVTYVTIIGDQNISFLVSHILILN